MKTLYLGPDELLVAAKVAFPKTTKVADVARAINEVEAEIREAVPVARVIYIEPDIYQAAQVGRAVDRRDRHQGRRLTRAPVTARSPPRVLQQPLRRRRYGSRRECSRATRSPSPSRGGQADPRDHRGRARRRARQHRIGRGDRGLADRQQLRARRRHRGRGRGAAQHRPHRRARSTSCSSAATAVAATPRYGERGENLNDVTILLHISPVSNSAIAVSLPRDLYVPISGCEDGNPGTRKINEALTYGGLACAVSTVENLTGLQIGYAAKIEFDGVIAMSNAVGGVDGLRRRADPRPARSRSTSRRASTRSQGWDALQFLRSRHGVGDGSDTTRISNQQLFLSALMRKIKSEGTLTNPLTIYALAKAAASNMQLSTSLSSLDTMASMALAVKNIPLANIAFVTYPSGATVHERGRRRRATQGRREGPDGCDRGRRADRRHRRSRRRRRRGRGHRRDPVADADRERAPPTIAPEGPRGRRAALHHHRSAGDRSRPAPTATRSSELLSRLGEELRQQRRRSPRRARRSCTSTRCGSRRSRSTS